MAGYSSTTPAMDPVSAAAAGGVAAGVTAAAAAASSSASGATSGITTNSSQYICGSCNAINVIRAREPVRCRQCGYRVLYKARVEVQTQFEAR